MALAIPKTREFLFENLNGIKYRVRLDVTNSVGKARKLTGTNSRGDGPIIDNADVTMVDTSFTIDAADLATVKTCHVSRLCIGLFYNTNTALSGVLADAS